MQGSHDSRSPHNPEQPLLAQLARLGSSRRGAILATLSPAPAYRLYCDPSDWISADGKPGVVEGLKRIEEARHERELIGWIGYEAGNLFEPAVGQALPSNEQLLEFGVYSGPTELRQDSPAYIDTPFFVQNLRLDLNRDEYIARVLEILEAIRRGEVYQVNLTMRLRFEFSGDPRSLFSALTRTQPARYGAILKNGEDWILSLSPELFFRAHGRRIVSMPMKGTTERGRTLEEDHSYRLHLQNDGKSRAENLMIVDLIRNDLGRICETGSVAVPTFFEIERLPTLFQMTSTVTGMLDSKTDTSQILHALFPCGSVTGAPKIAAMRLIRSLETSPRGVYCGAIGEIRADEMQFNVAIRTLKLTRTDLSSKVPHYRGEMGIGSGIVIDSIPEAEWEESNLKARFLIQITPAFSLIETLRFEKTLFRMEFHLDRMARSAEYFNFPFERREARTVLAAAVENLEKGPYRIRLLLDRSGSFEVESAPIEPLGACVRIGIASTPIDSHDRFLFHKTTNRELYRRAQEKAAEAGLWDLVFLNENQEVCEGSISNIFIRTSDDWWTPRLECGLLPGVMRQVAIEELSAREGTLLVEDLLEAEEVLVTNSVRGMVRATITGDRVDLETR